MSTKKTYKLKEKNKPFICNKCGKGFSEERYLQNHQRRKTPCDEKFICSKCKKEFPNLSTLKIHLNRATSCIPEEIVVKPVENEFKCQYCGRILANNYSLKRHLTTCNKDDSLKQILAQNKILIDKVGSLEQILEHNGLVPLPVANSTTNVTNIQQNNMYINVTLRGFGKEDFSKLSRDKVMDLVKNHADDFIPKMIEALYADPSDPPSHNIFFDERRQKMYKYASERDEWDDCDFETTVRMLTKQITDYMSPGSSPYFDIAMQAKDYETSNKIINIAKHIDWYTDEMMQKNKEVLSKIAHNKGFLEMVGFI